ncbi:MAG: hypothetical protein M3P04_13290 [Actinomycetota bacterium]|nr:hypothetical protein [Actinomycetota bacterium]
MSMTFPRRRLVVVLLVLAAVIILAYWTTWYAHREWLASSEDAAYEDFENAFPLADAWLAMTALLAAWALWKRRPSALLWLLCAGSAGVYLACMDVLYDLQHGVWWAGGSGGVVELVINLLTISGSAAGLLLGWRHRAALLAGQ